MWENSEAGEVLAQTMLIVVEGLCHGACYAGGGNEDGRWTHTLHSFRKVTLVEEQQSPESLLG